MQLKIAIIGRPNVGKSTLFNRLVGKKTALVDKMPGLTRDRREGEGSIADLDFTIIDTAGLEQADKDSIEEKMMEQTGKAAADADILLMLIDGRTGVLPVDKYFADWARRQNKKTILAVNKCEGKNPQANAAEAYALGLGDPLIISAEHGQGMHQLYQAINEVSEETEEGEEISVMEEAGEEEPKDIAIAIIGRPNAGKSTLLNQIVGEERSITGEQAGLTRDAITENIEFAGRSINLIDTAGMRKKANVREKAEKLAVGDAINALNFSHIVVLLIDATRGLEKQDLTIADKALSEGRGVVIAVNKWDAVKNKMVVLETIKERIEKSLTQAKGVPLITLSALKGDRVDEMLNEAIKTYDIWNSRISTGKLNKWLERMLEKHSPPLIGGRRLKIRYMTQVSSRPPRFTLFTNVVKQFPESYLRYLTNGLREEFDLFGVPIRIFPRKGDNPYRK